jgi:hypothetical protein
VHSILRRGTECRDLPATHTPLGEVIHQALDHLVRNTRHGLLSEQQLLTDEGVGQGTQFLRLGGRVPA